ncbi:Protein transport protein Sec31A [Hordeum vulgare]|nr:Protein transport protein Sec31A [Hordeum vulgare]
MKMEWDMARGGAHVIAGVEAILDFIPTKCWLKRVNLYGRVAFMSMSHSRGRAPRTGHEEGSREHLRFYMQIRDEEDPAMLVIPPMFVEVMKEWLTVRLPRVGKLSANKWCEFSV